MCAPSTSSRARPSSATTPEIVTREPRRGDTVSENAHASAERSDWEVSLDDLQASCANLGAASLVVSWFGNDLRCGSCTLKPGVDDVGEGDAALCVAGRGSRPRRCACGEPVRWHRRFRRHAVGCIGHPRHRRSEGARAEGDLLSLHPDGYSGQAIPMGQPAYPWRGRITCDPPPGRAGLARQDGGRCRTDRCFHRHGVACRLLRSAAAKSSIPDRPNGAAPHGAALCQALRAGGRRRCVPDRQRIARADHAARWADELSLRRGVAGARGRCRADPARMRRSPTPPTGRNISAISRRTDRATCSFISIRCGRRPTSISSASTITCR